MRQPWRTASPRVALTGEVFGPGVEVGGRWETDRQVPPLAPYDAEVRGVQVQVVGGVIVLPDAATLPLAQGFAAQHGGRRHVGDVRVEGGRQKIRQRVTLSL